MTESRSRPTQDFEAALHEVESNLDVRRLMIVVAHVLVPACTVATATALGGTDLPPQLAWLPRNVLWIVGAVLAVGGVWTSAILARCHFGLVVNGTKIHKVLTGELRAAGLNWLGVTTNFVALTALSAGGGAALVVAVLGGAWWALPAGLALPLFLMVGLRLQHARANRLCRRLEDTWQHGPIAAELRELHARKSLDATSADVSVVVTMAAALFAGTFDATCSLSSLGEGSAVGLPRDALQVGGVAALMVFTTISLSLTSRIVVRLRIALAEHSTTLAAIRAETDEAWRFRPGERTFLLYLIVALLAATAALIAAWTLAGPTVGGAAAAGVGLLHLCWYPLRLRAARPRGC
jgi:hypothetical protein